MAVFFAIKNWSRNTFAKNIFPNMVHNFSQSNSPVHTTTTASSSVVPSDVPSHGETALGRGRATATRGGWTRVTFFVLTQKLDDGFSVAIATGLPGCRPLREREKRRQPATSPLFFFFFCLVFFLLVKGHQFPHITLTYPGKTRRPMTTVSNAHARGPTGGSEREGRDGRMWRKK